MYIIKKWIVMKKLIKTNNIFLKEKHKDVYYRHKEGTDYFTIMNPVKDGKDYVVPFDKMEKRFNEGKVENIKKNIALMNVSKIYADYTTEWEYNNTVFKVMPRKFYEDKNIFKNKLNALPTHEFHIDSQYSEKYKLVWFQNKLYWLKFWHYYPKVCLYKFKGIERIPNLGTDFILWTDVKNIKPIINCDTNEFC